MAEVLLLAGYVVLDIAILLELRVPPEGNKIVADAVAVLVVEGLNAVEPEDEIDEVDQDEDLQQSLHLIASVL